MNRTSITFLGVFLTFTLCAVPVENLRRACEAGDYVLAGMLAARPPDDPRDREEFFAVRLAVAEYNWDNAAADAAIEEFAVQEPDSPALLPPRIRRAVRQGDLALARKLFEAMPEELPTPELRAERLLCRSELAAIHGRWDEAVEAAEAAAALPGDSFRLRRSRLAAHRALFSARLLRDNVPVAENAAGLVETARALFGDAHPETALVELEYLTARPVSREEAFDTMVRIEESLQELAPESYAFDLLLPWQATVYNAYFDLDYSMAAEEVNAIRKRWLPRAEADAALRNRLDFMLLAYASPFGGIPEREDAAQRLADFARGLPRGGSAELEIALELLAYYVDSPGPSRALYSGGRLRHSLADSCPGNPYLPLRVELLLLDARRNAGLAVSAPDYRELAERGADAANGELLRVGALIRLANLLKAEGDDEEAAAVYRQVIPLLEAVELDDEPTGGLCHFELGAALLRLKRNAEAIASLERAIEIAQLHPAAMRPIRLMALNLQQRAGKTEPLRLRRTKSRRQQSM